MPCCPTHWAAEWQDACPHLQPVYALVLQAGCTVQEISSGWSRAKRVLHFSQRLPAALRAPRHADGPVTDYHAPTAPHWQGDEGFFCEQCLIVLAFPLH
ncbi:hypothetical protein K6978_11410 [Xanthomonas cucurbitae]|uniref:Uncharacterized protein n=1 Tax=Xanthomonas cucurbitae TaxID=56453 RepID=A0ABY7Y888_9XANT|nr:hypothetical protein EBN15_09555 [Xanthomonas cucurbitae]WDM66196.1 hypothetical protein K6981_11440 [Xanthomonas cucurbitae]WDM70074.1 hypothetical protein K6978_11410 [Xanthomonas cucurbitae]WDM77131.1 hypothetical protein K6982_09525 [Xanthomonas cucurbitae]